MIQRLSTPSAILSRDKIDTFLRRAHQGQCQDYYELGYMVLDRAQGRTHSAYMKPGCVLKPALPRLP